MVIAATRLGWQHATAFRAPIHKISVLVNFGSKLFHLTRVLKSVAGAGTSAWISTPAYNHLNAPVFKIFQQKFQGN